ncbi:MAG: 16S rRNA (guanine(527)-N(7))-methyltransferase RsmG [Spirochaetaceae bacterium]|nr:16S rRNA (guanine(527)-N(7))-methyltransferase RsmG [Spirochaetaceae bacterium]
MRALTDGELLEDGLHRLGMGGDWRMRDRLQRFAALIEAANPVYRLVAADRRRLVSHHLLDSLAAVPALREVEPRATLLDVGSGAGLPGVPLALALAGTRVILVERSARRAAFLNHVCRELAPAELAVVARPLADAALAPVDIVTWRAVAPLARLLPDLLPVLHARSTVALYQGTAATVQRELKAAREVAGELLRVQVTRLAVPHLDAERHLVLLRGFKR